MERWTRQVIITWIASLAGATMVMLLFLLTGTTSLNVTFVLFLIVVKFIAGLGSVIGVITFLIFVLKKFASKFNDDAGKKRRDAMLLLVVLILVGLLVYQGPVKVVQSAFTTGNVDSLFDQLLFVYGIISLMVTMYIKPLARDEMFAITTITTKDMIKNEWATIKDSVKSWTYRHKKEHGKAELIVEMSLKQEIHLLRQRLAIIFMLPLGIGTFVFTPVCAIMVLTWTRIFIYTKEELLRFERYLALAACIAITVVACTIPFLFEMTRLYLSIQDGYIWLYVAQFAGSFIAATMYLVKLLRPIARRRTTARLKLVSKERDSLQRERNQLFKEKKQLAEEVKSVNDND